MKKILFIGLLITAGVVIAVVAVGWLGYDLLTSSAPAHHIASTTQPSFSWQSIDVRALLIQALDWVWMVMLIVTIGSFVAGFFWKKAKGAWKPLAMLSIVFFLLSLSGFQNLIDAGVDTIDKRAAEKANDLRAKKLCPAEPASNRSKVVLPTGDTILSLTPQTWTPWMVLHPDHAIKSVSWHWEKHGLCIAVRYSRSGEVAVIPRPPGSTGPQIPDAGAYAYASMEIPMEISINGVQKD